MLGRNDLVFICTNTAEHNPRREVLHYFSREDGVWFYRLLTEGGFTVERD